MKEKKHKILLAKLRATKRKKETEDATRQIKGNKTKEKKQKIRLAKLRATK